MNANHSTSEQSASRTEASPSDAAAHGSTVPAPDESNGNVPTPNNRAATAGSNSGSGNELDTLDHPSGPLSTPSPPDPLITVEVPSSRGNSGKRGSTYGRSGKDTSISISCPECHNRFVTTPAEGSSIACPSCGSEYPFYAHLETTCTTAQEPVTLGKFELVRELGKGAFGVVYLANDTELQRQVAIKVPRQGTFHSQEDVDRFLREARHTARLRHPGLVAVFEVGRTEKGPYIASEFVEGVTLSDALSARRFTFAESAMLVIELAGAIQHAHVQGVIHRDLKPSNIMLQSTERDSHQSSTSQQSGGKKSSESKDSLSGNLPQLDVRPRILDFGLARRDGIEQVGLTIEGQIVGTPAYMSPEQARGLGNRADRRCDIYSVGVILFELLTGERPFRGNARMVIKQAADDEPPKPRKLNSRIPRDLETICLKCMEKEPGKRYFDAQSLADDLRRFLQDMPIQARPISRLEYTWRWSRRHADVVGTGLALSAVIVAVTVAAFTLITMSRNQEHKARLQAEDLAQQNHRLFESEHNAHVATAESRQLVRNAVDSYMVKLSDALKYYPGVQEARRALLEEAVSNYAQIASAASSDPGLELERGMALQKLGDAYAALGQPEQAVESYREGISLFAKLIPAAEDRAACRLEMARIQAHLALALSHQVALPSAMEGLASPTTAAVEEHYGQAIQALQELVAHASAPHGAQALLATTVLNRALFLSSQDRLTEAARLLTYVQQQCQQTLLSQRSDDLTATLAAAQTALGHIHLRQGELGEAEQLFSTALATSAELVASGSDRFEAINQRAVTRVYLANLYNQMGDLVQEAQAYRETLDDYAALLELLPDSPVFRENAALIRTDYGQLLADLVRHEEAEAQLTAALAEFVQLQQQAPAVVRNYENAGACQDMLAELYVTTARLPQAEAACQESIYLLKWLVQELPEYPRYRERLAVAQARLGSIQFAQGDPEAGEEQFMAALALLGELRRESPEVVSYEFAQAMVSSRYAEFLAGDQKHPRVKTVATQAAAHWREVAADSSVPKYLHEAAWFFCTVADDSLRDPQLATELAEQASRLAPANPEYQTVLALAKYQLNDAPAAQQVLSAGAKMRAAPHGKDMLVQALLHHALQQPEQARTSHAAAAAWLQKHLPGTLDLQRLARETEALLAANNPEPQE